MQTGLEIGDLGPLCGIDAEVEVRARGVAGIAAVTDNISRRNGLADGNGLERQMRIERRQTVSMLQHDPFAK